MTIESIREAFELSKEQFEQIVKGFKNEYEQGLNTAEAKGLATMIPSYVTKLPTGQERGTFLALDLGGSTLRVCAVELLGNGKVNVKEMKRSIPMTDPLRQGHVDPFFDWIAETVELLLKEYHIDHKNTALSMGVSWSFPIDQTSVSDGTILRMGKGFDLKGIIGKDLKSLFTDAFKRKKINVKVSALVNDTVGVLVAHAYSNPKSRIGFIYGTGTNAAYPEKISKMVKLKATNHYHQDEEMLVNTEIDIFGSESYLPLNRFDLHLDQHHNQPKFQLYEKMMSGGYLGELVRLAALELINEKVLFHGCTPLEFKEMYLFDSSKLSDIESQANQPLNVKSSYIQSLFTFDTNYLLTEQDVEIIIELCLLVATRGAKLAGAAIASLIEQQAHLLLIKDDQQPIVIGVNGSTYELYPQMPSRILNSLSDWFGTEIAHRIQLEVARDGASIGSALIAMLYTEE
ncbi:hypothetical protein BJ944DRAFT_168563 [Cunninghamella echinulata]|nr:hypothetical protein BJ944DRAFT_168563 [Cunninghamella echinulata]